MAYIKTLKDNELVNGTNNDDVYPVSTTQALFSQYVDSSDHQIHVRMKDNKPEKLEDRLQDHESDAQELHRKTEKLVVRHTNNKSATTFEITDNSSLIMALTGSATIDTYGDESSENVDPDNMTVKQFTVTSPVQAVDPEHPEGTKDDNNWVSSYTIPNELWVRLSPGIYKTSFTCTYNNVNKTTEVKVNTNLKEYFGFASSAPVDATSMMNLAESHLDASADCNTTITIRAINDGFKHIYFAVPQPMKIKRIIQPQVGPDTPFAFHTKGTITRTVTINGNESSYLYNLYESGTDAASADGLEDTNYPKVLTLVLTIKDE